MKLRALLILLLLSACNAAPDRELDPPPDPAKRASATYGANIEPYGHCFAADSPCGPEVTTPCCDGLFCSTELLAYGPGACTAPQIDGSFCTEDAHCAGAHCVGNLCRSGSCAAQGSACDSVFPCCEGFVCDLVGYTEGVCVPPFENGRFCVDDTQCASARCFNNICADPSCRDQGAECYDDPTSCCPGLFCFQDPGAYGVALCAAPQPAGAFCLENAACASYSCVDNVCQ